MVLKGVEKLDYSWIFRFEDPLFIITEGQWRLISQGRIVVSGDDHGQQFGLPAPVDATDIVRNCIVSSLVQSVKVDDSTGDLFLYFSQYTYLQLLQTSAGFESWRAHEADRETICMGGGEINYVLKDS